MGDFGRPQMFWPSLRSILYFASWRLVIRVLVVYLDSPKTEKARFSEHVALRITPSSCPRGLLGPDWSVAEPPAPPAVLETRRGPVGPAPRAVSRCKPPYCQTPVV